MLMLSIHMDFFEVFQRFQEIDFVIYLGILFFFNLIYLCKPKKMFTRFSHPLPPLASFAATTNLFPVSMSLFDFSRFYI